MLHSDTIVRHNDYTNENPLSDRRNVSAPTFLVSYRCPVVSSFRCMIQTLFRHACNSMVVSRSYKLVNVNLCLVLCF